MVEVLRVHLVLQDSLALLEELDLPDLLELWGLLGLLVTQEKKALQVFVVIQVHMVEWEIEDQLGQLVALETKETQGKMGNLVRMAPQVQLELLVREVLLVCQVSEVREACLACLALVVHQENRVQQGHQEIKVPRGLLANQVPVVQ